MKGLLRCLILWLSLLMATPWACGQEPASVAQEVLGRLYQRAGRGDKPMPDIILSEENRKVAAYYPARHQIVLDEKAYRLCLEMGAEAQNALAFIISHELAHASQPGRGSTDFLAYGIQNSGSESREKAADIQGAFTAFLAGFDVDKALPAILERIYRAYGLWGKPLPGYPSYEERRNSTREALEMGRRLAEVFETANYMVALEEYEIAIACNRFLLDYYQSSEAYNNIGVLHLLQALQYYDESTGRFAHPLELEPLSFLKILERQRGAPPLSDAEAEKRTALLERAQAYFQRALAIDEYYVPALGNMACALNMLGRSEEAITFLKGRRSGAENLQVAYGISLALIGDLPKAEAAFRRLLGSSHRLYALQAQYNLDALQGQAFSFHPPPPFRLPEAIVRRGRALKPPPPSGSPLRLAESGLSLTLLKDREQSGISFQDATGPILSLVRLDAKGEGLPHLNLPQVNPPLNRQFFYHTIASPYGYFLRSDRHGLMLKVDRQGGVEEAVRWIRHRRKE